MRKDYFFFFFFFQAEDGIRDVAVTGVQTCALPISTRVAKCFPRKASANGFRYAISWTDYVRLGSIPAGKIGRASCREKSVDLGGRRIIKKKKKKSNVR